MLTNIILQLQNHQDLSGKATRQLLQSLLDGAAPAQAGAVLSLLNSKGITAQELSSCVDFFKQEMQAIAVDKPVLDIVGTGGDGCNTINISTPTALLVASCGVDVIKHGNRAASSLCGSTDLMEALGINVEHNPEQVKTMLDNSGFGYCFAPRFHPAMAKIKSIRSQLGVPTLFNLIGPLVNPASPSHLMIGVYSPELMPLFAECLQLQGVKHAMVYHGNGTDEITCIGPTDVIEINGSDLAYYSIDPAHYNLKQCTLVDLKGGDAHYNAEKIVSAFKGKDSALANTLILNAGVALYLTGHCPSIALGIDRARRALHNGDADQHLQRITASSHQINKPDAGADTHSHPHQSNNILDSIVATTRQNLSQLHTPRPFYNALSQPGLSLIGEIKRQTPSAGTLADITNPAKLATAYYQAGANALSVITEQHYFAGHPQDLLAISQAIPSQHCPILRKDFIIDRRQITQSVTLGANAILLILAAVKEQAAELYQFAKQCGLEVLVETHNREEIQQAIELGADIIGINNRNLNNFTTDIATSLELIQMIPDAIVTVSESGITTADQAQQLYQAGFDAILVGQALVTSKDLTRSVALLKPKERKHA